MADDKKKNTPVPEEDEADYITLEFDDGQQEECEILGVFDCDGKEYMALLPDNGSGDVYLYRYREINDEGEFEINDIEDDAEFERVADEFDRLAID
ncbi:MAG: DUF1292 domain-containing protein [Anaerovoracaceae bacterium]|nr:DUF1292 domain-containing protein [Bacillota bacterium]MDY2670553.1 DUF1292 domain-containing protein [Anaerovoracaceae bacterium]